MIKIIIKYFERRIIILTVYLPTENIKTMEKEHFYNVLLTDPAAKEALGTRANSGCEEIRHSLKKNNKCNIYE